MRSIRTQIAAVILALGGIVPWALGNEKDSVIISGQVLGPEGKPLTGAKIYISTYTEKNHADPPVRATSGPDGRFRFSATTAEVNGNESVVAVAEGYGPSWVELAGLDRSGALPVLRLVKEGVAITGRVLDLENLPIAGATVRVVRVRKMPREDLEPWLKDMQAVGNKSVLDLGRNRVLLTYERLMKQLGGVLGAPHTVKVSADGRFRLAGFGQDRVVELAIEGPGVETRRVTVVTRADLPKGLPPFTFGARFEFRASPAKPIVGTVREKGSGKPVPGVEIACPFVSGSGGFTDLRPGGSSSATTDDQGRYRLLGTPKSKQYHLGAAGGRYFGSSKIVNDTAGLEPITADFEMEGGLLIHGRLTDKITGRPVPGTIYYVPRAHNPHLKDYPGFALVSTSTAPVEKDGTFAVPAIPGQGLLCSRAADDYFARAELAGSPDEIPVLLQIIPFHAIVPINVSEKDPKTQACDLALDPGRTLRGRVYGWDGKPVAGLYAAGLTAAPSALNGSPSKPKLDGTDFEAVALDPRRPRTLVFWQEEKKIGKAVLTRGDEPAPLVVRLEPLGAVAGLLVDDEGRPQPGARVETRYSRRQTTTLPVELGKGIPGIFPSALPLPQATTGSDGRFRVEGLIAGLKYDIFIKRGKTDRSLVEDLSVSGGECKDLGTVPADRKVEK
jgi:hypothetical protein